MSYRPVIQHILHKTLSSLLWKNPKLDFRESDNQWQQVVTLSLYTKLYADVRYETRR